MRQKDKTVRNISALLKALKSDIHTSDGPVWFRGQPKKEYKLLPAYHRYKDPISEATLIKKFIQRATMLVGQQGGKQLDWLFIMQHHGVPTRLLDWSESPLVALFFACRESPKADGAVWALLPVELNKHAGVRHRETNHIPGVGDEAMKSYQPENYAGEDTTEMLPLAALSPRNTARMQAQLGTFTIFHKKKVSIEKIGNTKHVWRYLIPASAKKAILAELKLLGMNEFQLFPELQSIGDLIRSEL